MGPSPPTLAEILHNVASPPYTLRAFTAYLSQNHCMEILDFTLDLQKYAALHDQIRADETLDPQANAQLHALWDKLVQVYIAPCSLREINIPSHTRDSLLYLAGEPKPPHPKELEEVGRIVHELMNDSLVPFLGSVSALSLDAPAHERSSNRTPQVDARRVARGPRPTSTLQFESEYLTNDSEGCSPSAVKPTTPPNTPSTLTEWQSFLGSFPRAINAHNKGWKNVGAKLGFKTKTSTKQPTPTSSTANGPTRHSRPI